MENKIFPIIETKRLLLREIISSDAPAIYQYLSDKDVIRYLEGSTDTISEAEGYINEPLRPTEIGYILSKEYWNRGYMSEVLKSMLKYGFYNLNLHRIQGWAHPQNIASWKVMTKHGFIKEGTLREYIYV